MGSCAPAYAPGPFPASPRSSAFQSLLRTDFSGTYCERQRTETACENCNLHHPMRKLSIILCSSKRKTNFDDRFLYFILGCEGIIFLDVHSISVVQRVGIISKRLQRRQPHLKSTSLLFGFCFGIWLCLSPKMCTIHFSDKQGKLHVRTLDTIDSQWRKFFNFLGL